MEKFHERTIIVGDGNSYNNIYVKKLIFTYRTYSSEECFM